MEIRTKFGIGECVWVKNHKNIPLSVQIENINIRVNEYNIEISYKLKFWDGTTITTSENNIYKTITENY